MRADRIGQPKSDCYILTETNTTKVLQQAQELQPQLMIVDSIQTMSTPHLDSAPGGIAQVRECAGEPPALSCSGSLGTGDRAVCLLRLGRAAILRSYSSSSSVEYTSLIPVLTTPASLRILYGSNLCSSSSSSSCSSRAAWPDGPGSDIDAFRCVRVDYVLANKKKLPISNIRNRTPAT